MNSGTVAGVSAWGLGAFRALQGAGASERLHLAPSISETPTPLSAGPPPNMGMSNSVMLNGSLFQACIICAYPVLLWFPRWYRICTYVASLCIYATYIYIYAICTHVCVSMCGCMHACMHACTHAYIHTVRADDIRRHTQTHRHACASTCK